MNRPGLPPRRRLRIAPSPETRSVLWTAAAMIALALGSFALVSPWPKHYEWLSTALGFPGLALFCFALWRAMYQKTDRFDEDSRRMEELERAGFTTQDEIEFDRVIPLAWPTILTVLFAVPPVVFIALGNRELASGFLLPAVVISFFAWVVASGLGRGVIARLTPRGLTLEGPEIPWGDIANVELRFGPRQAVRLVIRLSDAHLSASSLDPSDGDIVVSLAHSREPASVIFELVRGRWTSVVGTRRLYDGLVKSLEENSPNLPHRREATVIRKRSVALIVIGLFALVVLMMHGMRVAFRATEVWLVVSIAATVAITIAAMIRFRRARSPGGARGHVRARDDTGPLLVMSLLGGPALWIGMTWSGGDLVTRAVGQESVRIVEFDTHSRRPESRCRYPLSLFVDDGRPVRICASPAFFARLPADGKVRVRLRESWLGVHIAGVSMVGD